MTTAAEALATIDRIAAEGERWRRLSAIGNDLARALMPAGLTRADSVGVSTVLHTKLRSNIRERDGEQKPGTEVHLCGVIVRVNPTLPDGVAELRDADGNVLARIENIEPTEAA